MRIHILGIAGTFMAGIARLALQAGHQVSGSDENIYPPMSTQLEELGVQFYSNDRLPGGDEPIDHYVVGNVMARSMPIVEELLDKGAAYSSGPQWLYSNILRHRRVLAVTGTHGKSTTSGMLAWILRDNGIDAGYLIGAIAEDLPRSSDIGSADCFVIEADEYDSAFFDKRPKFLHYQPDTLIINNVEHDHVDIYPRIEDIHKVFHYLLRQLPGRAEVIARADDSNIRAILDQGLWSHLTYFNHPDEWSIEDDGQTAQVLRQGQPQGALRLEADTAYNRLNALAALLAASKAGVGIADGLRSLARFGGIRRRLQLLHQSGPTSLYEDFAHHPTAIACIIDEFNKRIKAAGQGRLLLLVELGSYSMRTGHHLDKLIEALRRAWRAYVYCPDKTLYNSAQQISGPHPGRDSLVFGDDAEALCQLAIPAIRPGDQFVILSNRNFNGAMPRVRERVIEAIDKLSDPQEA